MKICMIAPEETVKGGIASVVNGYREYTFGKDFQVAYVESYCDGSKWKKLLKALKGYLAFRKRLQADRPDMVHVHSSFGPSFYRKIPFIYMAAGKGIPIINHIHGADFDEFYEKASPNKKKLVKKVYGKCNKLIALSEEWKKSLEQIVPAEKIEVIENYCSIPEHSGTKRKGQILFLGEIGERKGCFDIPAVFEKAVKEQEGAFLVMAGDGETETVKKLFAEKKLLDRVSFPGWVKGKEKARLLEESSIFLFPSYNEGMPMALLEAMAYGLAVVTTDVGGIPGLIENGKSGFICEPGGIEELSGRLKILLEDDAMRESFGKLAREQVIKSYSKESHMEKLLGLYKEVFKGGC